MNRKLTTIQPLGARAGGSPLAPSSFYFVPNARETKTTKTKTKKTIYTVIFTKPGGCKDSVPDGRWIDSVAGRDSFFQLPNRICQSPDDIFLLSDCICRVENRLVLLPFDH